LAQAILAQAIFASSDSGASWLNMEARKAPAVEFLKGRPMLILVLAAIFKLVVPGIAKVAGNRDPDENAISHVFGQQTICVAMDFPGWFEAAGTCFFVAGLMEAYALFRVYRISLLQCGPNEATQLRKCLLAAFFALMAVLSNGFSTIVLFGSPVATPTASTVLWHTVPYVLLQIERILFMLFLLAYMRSNDSVACVKVAWHVTTILAVASFIVAVLGIAWTLAEMSASRVLHLLEESFDSPFKRHAFFGINEYIFTLCSLAAMLLHPLGLRGGLHCPAEADPTEVQTQKAKDDVGETLCSPNRTSCVTV